MAALAKLSPELQMILLCARPEMTADQVRKLHGLAGSDVDWDRLISLAAMHGLRPLLHRNLRTHCRSLVPEAVERRLHQAASKNMANTMLLTAELEKILAVLEANGIPVIPYKGVSLGERLYGDAALRESGDIDIIVYRGDLFRARDIILALGYQPKIVLSPRQEEAYLGGTNNHYALVHAHHSVLVELHWDITPASLGIPLDWQGLWQRQVLTEFDRMEFRSFGREDLLLVLLIHGSKHRWEALKWLIDVTQQIDRNPSLDWSVICHRARQWRVERMALLGIRLSVELLSAPVPESISQVADRNRAVTDLASEVHNQIERSDGKGTSVLDLIAYHLRMRDRWRDRLGTGWRLLTALTVEDIDNDDRAEIVYYLRRPGRLIRRYGTQPLAKLTAQMLTAVGGRRR